MSPIPALTHIMFTVAPANGLPSEGIALELRPFSPIDWDYFRLVPPPAKI